MITFWVSVKHYFSFRWKTDGFYKAADWKWFRLIKFQIQGLFAIKIETTNYCNIAHLTSVSFNISNNFLSNPIDEYVFMQKNPNELCSSMKYLALPSYQVGSWPQMGTWTLFLGSFGYVLVLLGNFWFFWVLKGHILYKKMLNFNLTKAKNNKERVGSSPKP